MKTLSIVVIIAAVSAFVFLPVNFETVASIAFTLGFASILFSDYGQRLRQFEARKLRPANAANRHPASPLGLAA